MTSILTESNAVCIIHNEIATNNEKLNLTRVQRFRPSALIACKTSTTHHWHLESRNSLCYSAVSFLNPADFDSSKVVKYFSLSIF